MSEHTAMQEDIRDLTARLIELEAAITRLLAVWDSFVEILPSTFDESEMAEAIAELRRPVRQRDLQS